MRISDWSSDVCSSDLESGGFGKPRIHLVFMRGHVEHRFLVRHQEADCRIPVFFQVRVAYHHNACSWAHTFPDDLHIRLEGSDGGDRIPRHEGVDFLAPQGRHPVRRAQIDQLYIAHGIESRLQQRMVKLSINGGTDVCGDLPAFQVRYSIDVRILARHQSAAIILKLGYPSPFAAPRSEDRKSTRLNSSQ